jgi:hypothetical protein
MTTPAPSYDYIVATGVIVPDTSTLLTDVQQTYIDTFGADINLAPTAPQGVLITAETLAETSVANNNAQMANLINPNNTGGTALDAILALTGIGRIEATQTVVSGVTITGVSGTVITTGAQAQTAAGDLFSILSTVTIPSGGIFGPIPCAIGALNQIVSNVLGWETVNNSAAGVLGQADQPDQQARAYRNNTLGFQGVALPVAITLPQASRAFLSLRIIPAHLWVNLYQSPEEPLSLARYGA